jgi:hypothetical protein
LYPFKVVVYGRRMIVAVEPLLIYVRDVTR